MKILKVERQFASGNITHLHGETQKEVECCQGQQQHFKIHVLEVEQFQHFTDERAGWHHQPGHHCQQDQQDAEENDCRKTDATQILMPQSDTFDLFLQTPEADSIQTSGTYRCGREVSCEGSPWWPPRPGWCTGIQRGRTRWRSPCWAGSCPPVSCD